MCHGGNHQKHSKITAVHRGCPSKQLTPQLRPSKQLLASFKIHSFSSANVQFKSCCLVAIVTTAVFKVVQIEFGDNTLFPVCRLLIGCFPPRERDNFPRHKVQ